MRDTINEIKIAAPEFRGGNLALGSCKDLEVCLDGPAGTGKTFASLFKIHMLLTMYPGAKALAARKTNTALAGSAIATYREMIDPREGIKYFGGNRIRPAAFEYPNGSMMLVNGLDRPEKVKSLEIDLAYINEATECSVDDWEFVRSRLRHNKTPYRQLIADVNPVEPTHWLNQRMNDGITTRLLSRHEDNPRFFDLKTNDWTGDGYKYIIETLGGLTGVRLSRLRYGIWAAATGTVFEDSWDRARNIVAKFPIPREWPRLLAIDFGYVHPFVCLWGAIDPDGKIYIYRQIYRTKVIVEDHAQAIALASGWYHLLPKTHPRYRQHPDENADPLPREIICDHDADNRAVLERYLNLYTTAAKKTVSDGIQAVAARLRPAGDGKARLFFLRDSVVDRDIELQNAKKPTCTEDEFDTYVWDTRQGMAKGEQPVKEMDDGVDALRYMVASQDLKDAGVSHFPTIWR